MSVVSTPNASCVKVKFDQGTDLEGARIIKTKTFSSIKSTATDEDIMAVVNSISELQKHTLSATNRIDNSSLSE